MKLLIRMKQTKTVNAYDMEFEVPTFVNYLAIQYDGTIVGYEYLPEPSTYSFLCMRGRWVVIGLVDLQGHPNLETLVQVGDETE